MVVVYGILSEQDYIVRQRIRHYRPPFRELMCTETSTLSRYPFFDGIFHRHLWYWRL
jgi:hypothetical protein